MNKINWDFNEFLAFLLIYASHADLDFSDEEKSKIKEIVSPEVFENIYSHFKNLTDYQALELILSYKDLYFSSENEKKHLIDEMKKIFVADGEFTSLEKDLLQFLERLM